MIEDTNLRIGNLVIDGQTGTIVSVDGIQFSGRIVTYDETYDDNKRGIDAQPIPLTPEILEKCGFEYYNIAIPPPFYYRLNDITLIYGSSWLMYVTQSGRNLPLASLHQLQNLYFALTGEELKIEL